MALVGITGSDEGKLRGGESIASGKGVVVQQTPSGFSPLSGHGVGVLVRIGQDRQWRIDGGWPNIQWESKNRNPRNNRAQGKDGMGERSRAHAFIVPGELTGVNAMKAEVTASLVLVPCLVHPAWFAQGTIKSPWSAQRTTITSS
jgi:hypothetical protein